MTYEDIKKGLSAINLMLSYGEEYSPQQYAVHKEVLESARACVERLEKIEAIAEEWDNGKYTNEVISRIFEVLADEQTGENT